MVGAAEHVHIHAAGPAARAAGGASVLIDGQAAEGMLVEQGVEGPQGAEPLAEGPVEKDGQHHHPNQKTALPGKQRPQAGPDTLIGQRQGEPALQDPGGAEIFAEKGVAQPHLINHRHGQQDHKHHQNPIFQIGQPVQPAGAVFPGGELVQQLLKPSKGAQKAADPAPQKCAQKDEDAHNVVEYLVLGGADHRLQGANGAGCRGGGAGVTVQPRNAHAFQGAAV